MSYRFGRGEDRERLRVCCVCVSERELLSQCICSSIELCICISAMSLIIVQIYILCIDPFFNQKIPNMIKKLFLNNVLARAVTITQLIDLKKINHQLF